MLSPNRISTMMYDLYRKTLFWQLGEFSQLEFVRSMTVKC